MKLLTLLLIVLAVVAGATDVEQALVKIYGAYSNPDYYIPWDQGSPYEGTGSGCIIEGDLILTNAHVVANETYLRVRREGDPKMYEARVLNVSHDADLALITVDDPTFFEGRTPLRFGDLPEIQDEVKVYGYPRGGDALSITQGVVSRIENHSYTQSGLSLLCIQIDAAINPGNSGGPVLENNRIVGVAFQGLDDSNSIGYMVPVPVIMHFFEDIEDGVYDGFPAPGFSLQKIENESITEKYGIDSPQTGVLVTGVTYESPSYNVIFPEDIIFAVDGYEVAGDGTIELRAGTRTSLSYLFQKCQIGEPIPLTIIREGEEITVELILDQTIHDQVLVAEEVYDVRPEYFIYGGLVFTPLSLNFLKIWGSEWYNQSYDYFTQYYFYNNQKTEEKESIVVLSIVLSSSVNSGYEDFSLEIVDKVNGIPIRSFREFVDLVDNATGEFIEFRTNLGHVIILNRDEVAASSSEIMYTYRIGSEDRYLRE